MPVLPAHIQAPRRVANAFQSGSSFNGAAVRQSALRVTGNSKRALTTVAAIIKDGATLDRKLRVAVIGGGPSGACAAETLAKNGIETYLIERKMDNCKVSNEEGPHTSEPLCGSKPTNRCWRVLAPDASVGAVDSLQCTYSSCEGHRHSSKEVASDNCDCEAGTTAAAESQCMPL
jgi:hypothetical protein